MTGTNEVGLRDWFAGQALGGLLANVQYPPQGAGEPLDQFVARVTDSAFRIAEAMVRQGQRLNRQAPAAWASSISGGSHS